MAHNSPHVSIVLSDRNWILERLGKELQIRLPNIELNDAADPTADINYYITFACRKQPMPTLEMGWFAHMEPLPHLTELFYNTAREIDLPVTHSTLYRDMLQDAGIKNAIAIPPGVDHDRFEPKLRIGVVGRAYHTGRKGEGLVSQLMDMPGIDWHFTGTGWPNPGRFIPDEDLPDFYRSMDYILVPALYEGGPMCVPEALAVGTPVISSDVGWVREFPHIPFKNGDAADLRRVLTDLLETKKALHASTESYTWDSYAEAHEEAFAGLMKKAGKTSQIGAAPRAKPPFTEPVRLLLHGDEHKSLGGPTIRVPRTAEALKKLGVPAHAAVVGKTSEISEDIVHLFNVWNPNTALAAIHQLKKAGKKVVFSPIFLDLGERSFWHFQLPTLPLDDLPALAQAYAQAQAHQKGRGRLPEAIPGYNAMVREMLAMADHVIFLSKAERAALEEIGAKVEDARASLVHNPVDATSWQTGDPDLFRETYLKDLPGPKDYIVCIGRIEERKNQLLLARAVRDLPVRLVLIGHAGNPKYYQRIQEEAGDQVLMVGRLDPASDMLRSALAGARAFVLPSWSEGASLAALEAAATGANMVLSDRSSEQEYFGDLAHYCDPGDPENMRAAIEAALSVENGDERAEALRQLVARDHSWEHYAAETAKAYAIAAKASAQPLPMLEPASELLRPKVVFDVTTLANHRGRTTGIARVESLLSDELKLVDPEIRFVCWNDSIKRFIEVPHKFARMGQALRYCERFNNQYETPAVELPEDCTILVPGSAWMQNRRYVAGLETLKTRANCSLVTLIHDLIPFKFPFWFDKAYAPVFRDNFFHLARITDQFITNSQCCADDVADTLISRFGDAPKITPVRFGDPVLENTATDILPGSIQERFADKKFVLVVGAIHLRKNYDILYRVWARFADEKKHGDLHLVVVGGEAWNGQALAEQIRNDSRVNRNIHILSGIEDDTLGWLYQNCAFTAFPSHYEGWGLPVAESLLHGKLCLATNASSVPEIAPEFVEHIDPEDFSTWANKISFYAGSPAARAAREADIRDGYKSTTWAQTAQNLVDILRQPRAQRSPHMLYSGEIINTKLTALPLAVIYGKGWHPPESWGRWAKQETVSISVRADGCARPGIDHLTLLLKINAFLPSPYSQRFTITLGQAVLFDADVRAHTFPKELLLSVPTSAIDENGMITLQMSLPISPEKPKGGFSERNMGVGISALSLMDPVLSNPLQSLSETSHWVDGNTPVHFDLSRQSHRDIICAKQSYSEAWGTGSRTGRIAVFVPILPGAPAQDLALWVRPIATTDDPVTATLRWNGRVLGHYTWDSDMPTKITVALTSEDLARCSPNALELEAESLMRPVDLDLGPTEILAGTGLTDLLLTPREA